MKEILEKDINILKLNNEIVDVLQKNKITKIESLANKSKTELKNLGLMGYQISEIELKLQLEGLDLNGKYKINLEEENIVYIVEEIALSVRDAIESTGINLIIDTNTEEKIIKCDRNEIERCIINLLSNASKFTPSGGTITVDIEDLGEKVKITVEDTGIGIEEKYHKYIFDRFNQVVDENAEVKGGSGLGLTISKQLITLHGGHIYVESEVGIGSEFIIILPANNH